MIMSLAAAIAVAGQCAPSVAPETLLSIVQVESGFNPLAIGVNGTRRISLIASTPEEAASKAAGLIAAGRNVDLGLAQINSRNLAWLGLSVEQAFEPCANLAAAARVLQSGYSRADAARAGQQSALKTTFSLYNTGRSNRGFANGYVARVVQAASYIVPALAAVHSGLSAEASARAPDSPSWDVFGQASRNPPSFVISASTPASGDQP